MQRKCSVCHQVTNFELCKQTTWFTLFFIPVIPYSFDHCLVCSNSKCGAYSYISKSDFDKYKTLIESTTFGGNERERAIEIISRGDTASFFIIAPDGSKEARYFKNGQPILIKNLKIDCKQKWETPLIEEFCEEVRYYLARFEGGSIIELYPELKGKDMALGDYGVKYQEDIFIIKEHIYSNSYFVQISVIIEDKNDVLLVEIFDEDSNYVNSFTANWYMRIFANYKDTTKLHLYLSDRGGIFLIICENFKIN
jgi:hypothetical protein